MLNGPKFINFERYANLNKIKVLFQIQSTCFKFVIAMILVPKFGKTFHFEMNIEIKNMTYACMPYLSNSREVDES
jgi:hypothetical protein